MKRFFWLAFLLIAVGLYQPLHAQESDIGTIAIALNDGNIALYDVGTATLTSITSDARLDDPVRLYSFPTWGQDNTLAFFGTDLHPDDFFSLGVFVLRPDGAVKWAYRTDEEVFTYAYWSPAGCAAGICSDLAVLVTLNTGSLAVEQIHFDGEITNTIIGEGAPFYWDWSPDGSEMIWARFGETFDIYDVTEGTSERLTAQQSFVQTPDWSPLDHRLLAVVMQPDNSASLVIMDGDEHQEVVTNLEWEIAYAWSPDATYIAYSDRQVGELYILDSAGSEIAHPDSKVIAFFWSPDGRKIAYVTLADTDDRPGASAVFQQPDALFLQWHVYDLDTATNSLYAIFEPTSDMLYFLRFGDQFSRSHQVWSPDSRYITYAGLDKSDRPMVALLDTTQPGLAPTLIAEGRFAVFSWR